MQNATLFRRLGAMLYDSLLVLAVLMVTSLPFVALRGGEAVESDNYAYEATLLLAVYLFFVGFWTKRGRTLGMQSWRLRVITPEGTLISVSEASVRFLAAILSLLPFGLGFLWSLWDPERLTWHDRLSNTRLVYFPKETQ